MVERSLAKNSDAVFRAAAVPLYGFKTEAWHTFGPFFVGDASAVSSLIGSDHDMSLGGRCVVAPAFHANAEW